MRPTVVRAVSADEKKADKSKRIKIVIMVATSLGSKV
jgi:hypothetical protein